MSTMATTATKARAAPRTMQSVARVVSAGFASPSAAKTNERTARAMAILPSHVSMPLADTQNRRNKDTFSLWPPVAES